MVFALLVLLVILSCPTIVQLAGVLRKDAAGQDIAITITNTERRRTWSFMNTFY